jgi:CRISP-associated protein Cas1
MKRHLNTLYVTSEGSYVAKQGEALVVRRKDADDFRVPVHMISSVICFGQVSVSPFAMAHCARNDVAVSFLSPHGRFLARVVGETTGSVLLRKAQFRASEYPESALSLARTFVQAKIHNSRILVRRALRDHGDSEGTLAETAGHLDRGLARAESAENLDVLRGIEGEAARHYFRSFSVLVRHRGPEFRSDRRSRRPPMDRLNALLSFAYSLLASDLRSACECVGLDPQIGFLHSDRSGRPSLALDLMEGLRPVIAERVVLSLINRQQIGPGDFEEELGGAVRMKADARKTFLSQYQERKSEELVHPFLGDRITLGTVPLVQARLLAKALRGELDAYPAYLWR